MTPNERPKRTGDEARRHGRERGAAGRSAARSAAMR